VQQLLEQTVTDVLKVAGVRGWKCGGKRWHRYDTTKRGGDPTVVAFRSDPKGREKGRTSAESTSRRRAEHDEFRVQ